MLRRARESVGRGEPDAWRQSVRVGQDVHLGTRRAPVHEGPGRVWIRDLRTRLYRILIEIRDGQRALQPYAHGTAQAEADFWDELTWLENVAEAFRRLHRDPEPYVCRR
ncbi:hypothetical protein GCM10018773_63520 [Streptomyces candidus]|nr:hypothetical protein GCM10018773_63520 [Streptomyces candidus]